MHDIWKELRSFVYRFVIFVLHLFVLYFNAHVHISSLASPLKVRNFFIIWFIGLWSLCTLCMCMSMCMCVCTCLWIFPTEAPLTPAHWYQREFIFYIWAEGSKVPSTLNTSNKKKSVEMTKNNNISIHLKNDDVVPFFPISKSRYSIHETVFLINPLISSGFM